MFSTFGHLCDPSSVCVQLYWNFGNLIVLAVQEWQESIVARGLEAIEKATEALERRDDIFF